MGETYVCIAVLTLFSLFCELVAKSNDTRKIGKVIGLLGMIVAFLAGWGVGGLIYLHGEIHDLQAFISCIILGEVIEFCGVTCIELGIYKMLNLRRK